MAFDLKSESCSVECSFEVGCIINEKQCVVNIVCLAQFSEEYLGRCGRGGGKQPDVKEFICVRIGGGEPVLRVVDTNHGFVNRNLIQGGVTGGL